MIEPHNRKISIVNQCKALKIPKSTYYYKQKPVRTEDLELMRQIDEEYLKHPSYGSRSMRRILEKKGYKINRKRVQRLMRKMGIEAIYPKPRTSIPHPGHKIYPYLLRGMVIDRPNKVWASDITYVPMKHGFMYLVVVMDWYSRKVLTWRLSNTLDSDFCVNALEEAIERFGIPEIFNTDQGVQFTSKPFTDVLNSHRIQISMDGKGRCLDNVIVERLWWTVKYHYLYLWAFENGRELRKGLAEWFSYYNQERPHQSLEEMTPDDLYFKNCEEVKAA